MGNIQELQDLAREINNFTGNNLTVIKDYNAYYGAYEGFIGKLHLGVTFAEAKEKLNLMHRQAFINYQKSVSKIVKKKRGKKHV